jgi:uncharacterized protein (TIGR02268 family)
MDPESISALAPRRVPVPPSSLGGIFLAGALLAAASPTLAAERAPPQRELRRRTLTIDEHSLATLPEIHVAGGDATLLNFQIPVKEKGVILPNAQGTFYPVSQADRTVVLVPRADLAAPASVSVTLVDGTVLSFKLVSVPRERDVQVDVVLNLRSRGPPDSAAALQAALERLRTQLEECQDGSATATAARLAALLVVQSLDEREVFDRRRFRGGDKQSRLLVEAHLTYRLLGLTYLVFTVENRDPERVWVLGRADVKLTGGPQTTDLRVLAAATELASLAPGVEERLVVAFATPSPGPGQKLTVALLEKEGNRRVVLEGLSP